MTFDAVVGNPPYNKMDGSGGSTDSSNPLYDLFTQIGLTLNPTYFTLIIPAKWMVGGKPVLQKFRTLMYKQQKIRYLYDFADAKCCFPADLHLDAGVCYFLIDKEYNGLTTHIYTSPEGKVMKFIHQLKNSYSAYVIRDKRIESIIEKDFNMTKTTFNNMVSETRPFGVRKDLFNNPAKYIKYEQSERKFTDSLLIYGVKGIKGGAKRRQTYISNSIVSKNHSHIEKYKIFFTTSYSTNATEYPEFILAGPREICTETFLEIGPFNSIIERNNCAKYMRTKYFKFLLYFGKGTMQVNSSVFSLIPMQDFSEHSDIDWSKPVAEIDKQLYAKYGLSPDEISFIESMIKPME